MLSPYRVLDLTDNRAALGPMILADLGAEVIKIEPPGGLPLRQDMFHFAAYNRNKRSVTLDLDGDSDRGHFLSLVATADFLFENAPPGAMAARGLGFDELARVNPRLVYVATSPFGQDGPYSGHAATDLTLAAMGGMMAVNGDRDRPPLRVSVPQTWLHAALESAVAALVAHHRRLQLGEAQFVDVSVQGATFWTSLNAMIAYAIQGKDIERDGSNMQLGTVTVRTIYPCVDGYVAILANGPALQRFVPMMAAAGVVPEHWIRDEDWPTYSTRLLSGQPVVHSNQEVLAATEAYLARYTKQELFDLGLAGGVFIAPVNNVAELLRFEHLHVRRYWQPLALPDGREVQTPGPFVRFSRTPIVQRYGVPKAGEHTEAAISALAAVRERGLPARPSDEPHDGQEDRGRRATPSSTPLPLAGVKVADFSWVIVGPSTAKYLADHGATTIHAESAGRPDTLRVSGPFKDGVFGVNRSQYFGAYNTSKQSLALDLKNPAGQAVARRLLAWADVALESFTPDTMAALGLDYEAARAINPGIIMVSTCLMGQTGPAAGLAGYGTHAAAVSGFCEVTGWPDRAPAGPFAAYTDSFANRFLAASILAALDHRRRTGEGQYLEQSQMESALHFLTPEILREQVDGTIPTRQGNDSPVAAPHNAYPCAGEDQWCAIAVETDAQWQALRTVMGEPDWARDAALVTAAGRIARRAELDAHIAEWTRPQERYALMERLQAAGVPAGVVQRSSDLLNDPQLRHRHFFRPLVHPEMGEVPYEGHQFRIRGYDSGPRSPAPCLGEHSLEVLRDLLGMSDDEIAEVAASGALV